MTSIDNKNNGLKTQAKYINKLAVEVGSDIVKLAVKNGETSQNILTKVMKGGVTLFGMQQDFALTVLEKVAGNVKSSKYFKSSLKKYAETKETVAETVETVKENKYVQDSLKKYNEAKETLVEKVEEVKENKYVQDSLKKYNETKETLVETVTEKVELVKEKATETFHKVKANLNIAAEIPANVEETTTQENAVEVAKETIAEATAQVEELVEVVEETVSEAVETVTEVVTDKITVIKGLGAKTANVLTTAGYDSFEKLANATEEELRNVLAAAGTTFKKFNPAPWIEAAKDLKK